MKPVTEPPEWRRRARLAVEALTSGDLDQLSRAGLTALDRGDHDAASPLAHASRRFAWEQPDGVPGLLIGRTPGGELDPDSLVAAHAGPDQRFDVVGRAAAFLARSFELAGDDDDLAAAIELHDTAVALGDGVWAGVRCGPLGWAAAILYELTGEHAFLATAERAADVLCELQGRDGTWPADEFVAHIELGWALAEMADAVEARTDLPADRSEDDGTASYAGDS